MDAIPHTYLFTAYYIDNTEYIQALDDVSLQDSQRSCFFDIGTQPIKDVPLWAFALRCVEGCERDGVPRQVAVDLRDGHFEMDGKVFYLHDEDLRDFQPIYFRRINQHRNMAVATKTGEVVGIQDRAEIAGYGIGWKAKDRKGKSVEKVLNILFPK